MAIKKTVFVSRSSTQQQSGSKGGMQQIASQSDPIPHTGSSAPISKALPNDGVFGIDEETLSPKVQMEAKQEVKKEEVSETKRQEEKLENLTKNSQKVLFKTTSVFPFDFFPDELSIEPTQVNLKRKDFFLTNKLQSVPIKNISDVIVQTVPFFASIKVVDQFFAENSFQVFWIKKDEAERARKIIQGLVIASKEGVDVSRIQSEQLTPRVEKLGQMRAIE